MVVALRARELVAERILVDDPLAHAQHRVGHRHVDELALAGAAGVQHRADHAEGERRAPGTVSPTPGPILIGVAAGRPVIPIIPPMAWATTS